MIAVFNMLEINTKLSLKSLKMDTFTLRQLATVSRCQLYMYQFGTKNARHISKGKPSEFSLGRITKYPATIYKGNNFKLFFTVYIDCISYLFRFCKFPYTSLIWPCLENSILGLISLKVEGWSLPYVLSLT